MIHSATPADEAAVIGIIVLAFAADPAARWTWSDPDSYLSHFPAFVRALGGRAFVGGGAHLAEGNAGAALWLSPGTGPDEHALDAVLQRTVPSRLQGDVAAVLEQMGRYHPSEPHWYLPFIAVDPARQGKGHGSALMRHALAACDREGRLAYLESSNPKNVPLYQRHGFELLGTIQAGGSPSIFPMLRKPIP
jgi:ribosomal protein S18 acetylase RimI-like enzyme